MRLKILILLCCAVLSMQAQRLLTLEECIAIGIENNLSLKQKRNAMESAKLEVSENRAKLLPQISGYANLNDNFMPPSSVTDGRAAGRMYNVTPMVQYNAAFGMSLKLPLYNQQLYTSMDLARMMNDIATLDYAKAKDELVMSVCEMYYMCQVTAEQLKLVSDNIARLEELRDITAAFYDNGMVVEVDLKRVNINIENLRVRYDNAKSLMENQINRLKYIIDYPLEESILLTDIEHDSTMVEATFDGLASDLPELQLVDSQLEVVNKKQKLVNQGYIPSLSFTANVGHNAYSHTFVDWFEGGTESNKLYNSNGIGLSLQIPIFDGLEKRYKNKRAKLDVENARITVENTRNNFEIQYINAMNDFVNNRESYYRQKENYELAEEVYRITMERYKEGIATMTEVLQDEMRMSEAQNGYLSAHLNYRVANLRLMKLTGKLYKIENRE